MNIANIFGLHLGCMVKCRDFIFTLTAIDAHTELVVLDSSIKVNGNRTIFTELLKDCKLILKPLSSITDEDKAEFMEKFYPIDSIFWRYMRIVSFQASGLNVYSTRREESYSVPYTYHQALFLSTKGYKIEGIVPDEYCEVEE